MDSFCQLKLHDPAKDKPDMQHTKTMMNENFPRWDEKFDFVMISATSRMEVVAMDRTGFMQGMITGNLTRLVGKSSAAQSSFLCGGWIEGVAGFSWAPLGTSTPNGVFTYLFVCLFIGFSCLSAILLVEIAPNNFPQQRSGACHAKVHSSLGQGLQIPSSSANKVGCDISLSQTLLRRGEGDQSHLESRGLWLENLTNTAG